VDGKLPLHVAEKGSVRDGAQVGAIDEAMKVPDMAIANPAPVRGAGMAIGG